MPEYKKDQPCLEPGCTRLVGLKGARGRCQACNQRNRRAFRKANPLPCSVNGCEGKVVNAGTRLCDMHRARVRRYGDVGQPAALIGPRGDGFVRADGYRVMKVDGRQVGEHRLVMEQILGRPLEPFETVHHRNGRRSDNDESNLELWVKPQPYGQRPEDLVAWVVEHYPDLVEAELRYRRRDKKQGQMRLPL